jgi:hypothetical protein
VSRASRHRAQKEGTTPPRRRRTKAEVLRDATETLQAAFHGLQDLLGDDPDRRGSGLRAIPSFGVATTQTLQNLSSIVGKDEFEAWYAPFRKVMEDDPLMRYFWDLRISILKKGTPGDVLLSIRMPGGEPPAQLSLRFANPPTSHAGVPLTDFSVESLSLLYLNYLLMVVEQASKRFAEPLSPGAKLLAENLSRSPTSTQSRLGSTPTDTRS